MSTPDTRQHQTFPVLSPAQIEAARRFASGPSRHFAAGATVYQIGEQKVPAWLVLEGTIEVFRRAGLGGEVPMTTYGPGQFSGEVSQLAGRPSITSARAGPQACRALPFDAAHLRALIVGSAELGEIVMRALILRRVSLIEAGGAGTILIGAQDSPEIVQLQEFLTRNGFPNLVLDAATDPDGRVMIERLGVLPDQLPLVVCPSGTLLKKPGQAEVARCLGMTPELDAKALYDVAIVGAGPAGLAAAVYAASEGLSVIVLDERAIGGQAGASSRIENYLGFPTGISGQALAGRAFSQALKFGAEIALPLKVERLDCKADLLALDLSGDRRVRARVIVIATGARYRRPAVANLETFEGAGISYWASPIEARLCAGEAIALVGGGNSAGQAIVFLAPQVRHLHLIVRRPLAETMSRYLIDRIAALSNVEIHVGTEIASLEGNRTTGLCAVTFRYCADGTLQRLALRHLFLFIGADPNAEWLAGCVETNEKGFVVTGLGARPLETSQPGVFAIGDVRAGSTKRVAAAVGEGAAVVAQIYGLIAARPAGGEAR